MDNTYDKTQFLVYIDQNNNLYVLEGIAFANKIQSDGKMVMIKDAKYIQVSKEDIAQIERNSNYTKLASYKRCNLSDEKLNDPITKPMHQASFLVYVDQNNNMYINEPFAKSYNVTNKGQEINIHNNRYIQVNNDDINYIIENSGYFRVPEYIAYQKYENDNNQQQVTNNNYFIYFENVDDNVLYVDKEMAELCKSKNITISRVPKLIQGKEYYDIAKENLEKLMKETNHIGQKQSIVLRNEPTMKINLCRVDNKMYIPKGLFSKHGSVAGRKIIIVDTVEYVEVNEEDIISTRIAYTKDGINTKLNELKIIPKKTDDKAVKDTKDDLLIQINEDVEKVNQKINEIHKKVQEVAKKYGYESDEYLEALSAEKRFINSINQSESKKQDEDNTKEALKRINDLKDMLNKQDDTLMLPERIQK